MFFFAVFYGFYGLKNLATQPLRIFRAHFGTKKIPKSIGRRWPPKPPISSDFPQRKLHGEFWGKKSAQTFFPQRSLGRALGKNRIKPPIFPMVEFGLGGLGLKIPKIHWEDPVPGFQKFDDLPLGIGPKLSTYIWKWRPPRPLRLKVTIGKWGGVIQPRFSPNLFTRRFWTREMLA